MFAHTIRAPPGRRHPDVPRTPDAQQGTPPERPPGRTKEAIITKGDPILAFRPVRE